MKATTNTNNEVAKESLDEISFNDDALPLKLGNELFPSKPVLRWVLEKGPVKPTIERVARDLFKEEAASRPQDATYLGYCALPFGYVMDDSEVEHRIE